MRNTKRFSLWVVFLPAPHPGDENSSGLSHRALKRVYSKIPKQPKPHKKYKKPRENKQKQEQTDKTTGPLKTVKPLLKITKKANLGGPGDGGGFWDLAI